PADRDGRPGRPRRGGRPGGDGRRGGVREPDAGPAREAGLAQRRVPTIVAVSDALGVDVDGLPLFPPLPGGRAAQPAAARSVARLVAGLRTAVVTVHSDDLAAMVVFVEHEPVDGVALRGGERVVGPD